ncbi:MAG TPA: hypothetical protein VHB18_14710 [Mycobacteriales bacterium]|jgi:hypothetical protein|nr:hypothetical protein [Mycobacteriales bacterium]
MPGKRSISDKGDQTIAEELGSSFSSIIRFLPEDHTTPSLVLRDTWMHLCEVRATLAYYADAADQVGYPLVAERHRSQIECIDALLGPLHELWYGEGTVLPPTTVEQIRRDLMRLNNRVERGLAAADRRQSLAAVELVQEVHQEAANGALARPPSAATAPSRRREA